ncbi:hypothetical protein AWC25_07310 [Mycobacterium sherrisii]|uniref:Secreted protein n=2 Tax=Mycobacterium sherrisii TaxID=243061 RepID=A0A1E3SCT3_9MYCO|nr:hypothetical protein [Mycobacterium sherrisii]MCV7031027.1 hypothetical protein [Mycobacterium sherrisii]ODQ99985.1 hypothetical protein BHQ21_24765 [Mycobacterium sherrisii]ORW77962.1 hypothetical protein AWC25_07310 [Mycobacterium sherrisii]
MPMKMKRLAAAGVLAGAGLMAVGLGISNADTIQTEGSYPTREACQDAGPGVKASTPGGWNNFWCVPDRTAQGNWRLVLSN